MSARENVDVADIERFGIRLANRQAPIAQQSHSFQVPPELEAELSESIAQADRGETISADELLARLRRLG